MKNKNSMTKQEIRETFEDIQFCFNKLHVNAYANNNDPTSVGYCVTAFGLTLNNEGLADENSKFFNMCIGDIDGVMTNLSLMIKKIAENTHCTPGTIYSYLGAKLGIGPFEDGEVEF